MSRYKAAAIHLVICIPVASLLLSAFWFVLYPAPMFQAVGGLEIFLLLLGVDIALGPLLTLIVFNTSKKSLKFDLASIAIVQVAALAYGVFTLYSGRPVYVASLGHRFDLIQASEISGEQLASTGISLPHLGPQWVGTKQATDKKERENMLFSALGGADYGHYPQYHVPIAAMKEQLIRQGRPISELRSRNRSEDDKITSWLKVHNRSDDTVLFQGLKARSKDMAVILDAKTAEVIGIAPFKPWD